MARSHGASASGVRDKLVRKDLPSNLALSLLRSQRSESHEFRRFFDSDSSQASRERLAFAVQTEQIELLSLLFSLFFSEPEISSNQSIVGNLAQYLLQSCQIDHIVAHSMKHLPRYAENDSTIAGLTQLVCLAMLQLHRSYKA